MTDTQTIQSWLARVGRWVFIGLLAYMPLHIFLSTWIGTSLQVLELTRILKDVVLIVGFGTTLLVAWNKPWFKGIWRDKLVVLILVYGALTLLLALLRPTDLDAEILGVVYNTRFLIFFLYGLLLVNLSPNKLRRHALVAVLGSALIVLCFGIIQYTVLPNSALSHVGYARQNGVLPAFFIDDKPDLERIMSTLRDPNSFGSYVIIIGSLALALILRRKKEQKLAVGFMLLSVLCLWQSFSRSAWIGFIVAILTGLAVNLSKIKLPKKNLQGIAGVLAGLVLIVLGVTYISKDTYFVKNVVFHADESTVLEDPNELRIRFWKESLQNVAQDPLGSGPGTAGLASIRNNIQGTELNENYYLQIASEVGVVGIGLFFAILAVTGLRMLKLTQKDWLALALFASFTGLLITNFLVHIWSNEAVAYTWWGLAGIVLGKTLLTTSKKRTNTT